MTKKVLLFLAQGFEAYEASAFIDTIGWSREAGTVPIELVTTGFRPVIHCYQKEYALPLSLTFQA
jgi:protein deglycase